jgi:hypothetical protein
MTAPRVDWPLCRNLKDRYGSTCDRHASIAGERSRRFIIGPGSATSGLSDLLCNLTWGTISL